MAIRGGYAPPGVYTESVFESPTPQAIASGRVPLYIGTGRETVISNGFDLVRGSSSTIDQNIVEEDAQGRSVLGQNPNGTYILGDFDGVSTKIQTKQFPLVTGEGTGTTTKSPSSVSATVNGEAVVVLAVDGVNGVVSISVAPQQNDDVRISYFFNRTDTQVLMEDLSSQVTPTTTTLKVVSFNASVGRNEYSFTNDTNSLVITVDGSASVLSLLTLDTNKTENLDRLVSQINASSFGSLVASKYTNAYGSDELELTANGSILIGNGTSNSSFGFFNGQKGTSRNAVFYSHYNPIVDGSNGGITSTSVSDVKVYVDDVEVTPVALDGATGAITLDLPPKINQTVKVDYYFNSFKDQFDYIPSRDVQQITRVSETPTGGSPASLYLEDVDWVLREDKILWGSAVLASNGTVQEGSIPFGSTQITALTKDDRIFNDELTAIAGSLQEFKLNYIPVDGTGSGKATSRTDLVQVKVGYTLSDALERSNVAVSRVNPSNATITLTQPILAGQKVFATYYYNVLQDASATNGSEYKLEVVQEGGSNSGLYSVTRQGSQLFGATYLGKGTDLSITTLKFPSGSELLSDARISAGKPVEENVTVRIEDIEGTSAFYVSNGNAPYTNTSSNDTMVLKVDGNTLETFNFSDAVLPTIVSSPLPYETSATSNETNLGTVDGAILLEIDGVAITGTLNNQALADVSHFVSAFNTASKATPASYTCMNQFNGQFDLVATKQDQLTVDYVGVTALGVIARTSNTITITADTYDVDTLAEHIEDQLLIAFDGVLSTLANNDPDDNGSSTNLSVTVNSGRLVFTLSDVAVGDEYGYIEFVSGAVGREFEQLGGIDTDSLEGSQTKFGILPIANFVSTDLSGLVGAGEPLKDRLILRSRTLIGANYHPVTNLGITVVGGSILSEAGLTINQNCPAIKSSTSQPLTLTLDIGFNSQKANESLPSVLVYDGQGDNEANNVLSIEHSGSVYNYTITGSANGTEYNASELLTDIETNLLDANTISANNEQLQGSILRFDLTTGQNAYLKILDGSANSLFGLDANDVFISKPVTAESCVASFMGHSATKNATSFNEYLFSENIKTTATTAGEYYQKYAVSFVVTDASNNKFIGFESLTVGTASIIEFSSGTALTTNGSGLKISQNEKVVGENSYQGFYVTSDNVNGSGTANTSKITANGNGQDGIVGQTYIDSVTGFAFTLLQRDGGLDYATGANATLSFSISSSVKANGTIPTTVISGAQLTVANTVGANIGDTAIVETFNKDGREPSIGEVFYLDFVRNKSAFGTAIFDNLVDVVNEFGEISTENTLSMGAYFAFLNGATRIALKQVPKLANEADLTTNQVLQAIQDVEGEVLRGVNPSLIIPLVPANELILNALSRHCDVQSSLRFRSERTAIMGFNAGTLPSEAQRLANVTRNARVRLVYPEIVSATITNTQGISQTYLLDGRYLAVACSGATTAGTIDVATPWTNLQLVGFNALSRNLDAVEANQTAQNGVTVLQQTGARIVIRQGLTTDMSSVLTKTPTVIQIADEVHLRARNLLGGYIGIKFLPSVLPQIEGRVNALFKQLVSEQIIDSFSGISVTVDPEDPTSLLVECFYKPVFPLLYIQFTFNIRSSL